MSAKALCGLASSLVLIGAAQLAAQTAMQRVTFQVIAVNRLSVSGDPTTLVVSSAAAGSAPAPVTAAGGTYAITTNGRSQKISAALDAAMPTGLTLEVTLTAPPGAASSGPVALGTAGVDVVTGITPVAASALPITYRLSASDVIETSSAQARTVTFTVLSAP